MLNFFSTRDGIQSNVQKMKAHYKSPVFAQILRPRFLFCVALAALVYAVAQPLYAAENPTPYEKWTKSWAERPATSAALGGVELKAIVSLITGEASPEAVAGMTPVDRLKLAYKIKVAATEVAASGKYRSYFVSNTDSKTEGSRQFSDEDRQKLDQLLAQLPDDHAQLPPAGRRVVVQTRENGAWHVRVYDGNQLPAEVKSLLDLLANPYLPQL
jgi:hypothetical protein